MNGKTRKPKLRFREIDLERHAEICIRFRADSFAQSFGSADRFFAEAGPDCCRYLQAVRNMNHEIPGSCVHVWLDGQIVGQIEFRNNSLDRQRAHVLLYYLAPGVRGCGLGDGLEAYVMTRLREERFQLATLRVSPTNARAFAYYRKHGWTNHGPDPRYPEVNWMGRWIDRGDD